MIYALFSGGIDSWAALLWAKERFQVEPVYIDVGQAYSQKEIAVAQELAASIGLQLRIVSLTGLLVEDRKTGHILLRNLLFILRASLLEDCEGVVFGLSKGEISEDSTPEFIHQVERLLAGQFKPTIYNRGRKFKIYIPFASKSKAQTVAWLKQHSNIKSIYKTVGCYNPGIIPCGRCSSCFNRWAALELNHLHEVYATHPANLDWKKYDVDLRRLPWRQVWRRKRWYLEVWRAYKLHKKQCAVT